MRLVPALVAMSISALAPAYAAHFEASDGGYGASVSVTDDGCTASVLFDAASVSDLEDWYSIEIPLVIVGRANLTVEARGFSTGGAPASSTLSAGRRQRTFFENGGEDGNWSRSFRLSGARGQLDLQMETNGYYGAEPGALTIDTIDFVIENCGR